MAARASRLEKELEFVEGLNKVVVWVTTVEYADDCVRGSK